MCERERESKRERVWFNNSFDLTSLSATKLYRGRVPRMTPDNFTCYHTERGDHDFCLSRLHYTDTDPISREGRDDRTHDLLTSSSALY